MKDLFRKEIQQMKAYHLATPPHQVKLNQNESAHDVPSAIKSQILVRFVETPWNRYGRPYAEELCERIGRFMGWSPEGIAVANGSNVLIQALMMGVAVKQTIMTVSPTFSLYRLEGQVLGNRVVEVPLLKNFAFPEEDFLREMKRKRPQVIFLANPNAPTGNLFSEAKLLKIIESAPGLVVIDEAYYPYSQKTLFPYLSQFPQLVLLRTFSKAFALAGIRIGYMIAHPAVIQEVRKTLLPYCMNALSQIVAMTLLDHTDIVQRWVQETVSERDQLASALSRLPRISPIPSAANFVSFRCPSAKKTFQGLLEQGLLVRDISDGGRLRNYLRVTVGPPHENARFLQALRLVGCAG